MNRVHSLEVKNSEIIDSGFSEQKSLIETDCNKSVTNNPVVSHEENQLMISKGNFDPSVNIKPSTLEKNYDFKSQNTTVFENGKKLFQCFTCDTNKIHRKLQPTGIENLSFPFLSKQV